MSEDGAPSPSATLERALHAYFAAFLSPPEADDAVGAVGRQAADLGVEGTSAVFGIAHGALTTQVRLTAEVEALVLVEESGLGVDEAAELVGLTPVEVAAAVREAHDGFDEAGDEAAVLGPQAPAPPPPPKHEETSELPAQVAPSAIQNNEPALLEESPSPAPAVPEKPQPDVETSSAPPGRESLPLPDERSAPDADGVDVRPEWQTVPATSGAEEPLQPRASGLDVADPARAKRSRKKRGGGGPRDRRPQPSIQPAEETEGHRAGARGRATATKAAPTPAPTAVAPVPPDSVAKETPRAAPAAAPRAAPSRRRESWKGLVTVLLAVGLLAVLATVLLFASRFRDSQDDAGGASQREPPTSPIAVVQGVLTLEDVVLTDQVDEPGLPGAPQDVFLPGQPARLWMNFDYTGDTSGDALLVIWYRDDVEVFRSSVALPQPSGQATMTLAASATQEPGPYRADIVVRQVVAASVDFEVAA